MLGKRNSIFLLIFFLIVQSASSQIDINDSLKKKIANRNQNLFQEKLFLHSDRSLYISGETIWFKIYLVDAVLNSFSEISKVAYVELLDAGNKPVFQAKIDLLNGKGEGFLPIMSDLNSGVYTIRAYTNWMKNFDPSLYYYQSVSIINTFKVLGLTKSKDSTNYDVQFFPEGGNLVEGLTTKLAFKGLKNGKSFPFNGYLIGKNNDTISKFNAGTNGLGSFYIKPSALADYKIFIIDKGRKIPCSFPKIYNKGVVMNLMDLDSANIQISVNSNIEDQQSFYLSLFTKGKIESLQKLIPNEGKCTLNIKKQILGVGISDFILLNDKGDPLCERLYFNNQNTLKFNIEPVKNQFNTREKVQLKLSMIDTAKLSGNFSISVFEKDSITDFKNPSIQSYLLLSSELRGKIDNPDQYFDSNSNNLIDIVMLTHGWRRFKWDDSISKKSVVIKNLPELSSLILEVKVIDTTVNLGVENVEVYLSSPNIGSRVHLSKSNKNGVALFELKDMIGLRELIIQTNTVSDRKYKLIIGNSFTDTHVDYRQSGLNITKNLSQYLIHRSISMQAQNIYKPQRIILNEVDSIPFFGKGDFSYKLDDYTRFKTLWEVLTEYVTPVVLKKRKDGYNFSILDVRNKNNIIDGPLVLLDGVFIRNIDSLLNINPLKIKKIDVVAQKYFLGPVVYNGIVSFSSYEGDMAAFPIDKNWTVIDYEGIQLKREFYSPKYENEVDKKSRIPDMRSLLYWNPNVNISTKESKLIEFYTSDLTGDYIVNLQGLTDSGIPFTKSTQFKVVK